mmetsp:Transcript_90260/g.188740  ORF Transcript_90260/g.188740 Transcript_90260/m.188740 type:complete len:108 (+) Transcript_90260:1216-1539(+)
MGSLQEHLLGTFAPSRACVNGSDRCPFRKIPAFLAQLLIASIILGPKKVILSIAEPRWAADDGKTERGQLQPGGLHAADGATKSATNKAPAFTKVREGTGNKTRRTM